MKHSIKYYIILSFIILASCKEEKLFFEHKSFQFGLYKDDIPCDAKSIKQEVVDNFRGKLIEEIRNPEIQVFLPDRFEDKKIPFFLIVPGNDGKTITYGSQGESLFGEMKKLDIGVALWTYRLPHMASSDCSVDIVQKDLKALQSKLNSYIPNWQVNLDEIGVIAYGNSSKFIYEEVNANGNDQFFKHQIYLEPNVKEFEIDSKTMFSKETNILLLTSTSKSPLEEDLIEFHEYLLNANCNSTLLEMRDMKAYNAASFRPFRENIFPWIIRKVDFDYWGKEY